MSCFCPACTVFPHCTLSAPINRYEDNGDAVNNIAVMVQSTDKTSITGFGDPAKFLEENKYLLGKQVFVGAHTWS